MPSNAMSVRFFLLTFTLALATIAQAAPPAYTLTQDDKSVPLHSETLAALYEVPEVQRFDFVVRLRTGTPEEIDKAREAGTDYPQSRAVLQALRAITGQDGGDSPGRWRELISITTNEK